jgi:hypothetical protein
MKRLFLWSLFLASFHINASPKLPKIFQGFETLDARADQALSLINQKTWYHTREFKDKPCEGCKVSLVHFRETVEFVLSRKDLHLHSTTEFGSFIKSARFVTGTDRGHIAYVKQRILADGSIELLYAARTRPYIYESRKPKLIEWALLDPRFFSMEPNYDAFKKVRWDLFHSNSPTESVTPMEFMVLTLSPAQPMRLKIRGYQNAEAQPVEREFALASPS